MRGVLCGSLVFFFRVGVSLGGLVRVGGGKLKSEIGGVLI